jgi:hypothetical protein
MAIKTGFSRLSHAHQDVLVGFFMAIKTGFGRLSHAHQDRF